MSWHDRKFGAGEEWTRQINEHLNSASIIVLLVSADFMNSSYYDVEVWRAMKRHERGRASIIPINFHPADWNKLPFKVWLSTRDAKPLPTWHDQDAFVDIANVINQMIKDWEKK